MLRWRLILEEYGPDIKYILGKKNIAADAPSQLPNNIYQETKHGTMYATETMSELCDIEELPNGTFPLYFKLIDRYQ